MRNVTCEKCECEFPMNDTLKVHESLVCRACAESILAKEKIRADQVQHQIDPTICAGCGLDNGNTELSRLGQVPVCPDCEKKFKNRQFPMWVKATLIGIVILVVSILVWNSRFIYAYYDLRCFASAMNAGDIDQAAAYFVSASKRVPENKELQIYGALYEGIVLLNQDKSAEALKQLQSCRGRVGVEDESYLNDLIINAQIGVAFDQAEYDEFLQLSLRMSEKFEDNPAYTAQLASAYACMYAETQDEQYKAKSLATLESAKILTSSQPEYEEYYAEYEQRILHRLHTREIINSNEFYKRYPDGWTKEEQEIP